MAISSPEISASHSSAGGSLSVRVQQQLQLALDYTEQLEQGTLEAQAGLMMPAEMTAGLSQQRQRLQQLCRQFDRLHRGHDDAGAIDGWLFDRLRDLWSLHTPNPAFQALTTRLFGLLSGEPLQRLRHDLEGQLLVVHMSCRARIERARTSVRSFPPQSTDVRHLIVVGDPAHQGGGFVVDYDGECLRLPCRDNYESLAEKCLHCYAVLAFQAAPRLLYKIDDDVQVWDWAQFRGHLDHLLEQAAEYAGNPNTNGHRGLWHGWHLGKCERKVLETIGCQMPLGRFAEGGLGYALGPRALHELAYAFFTHRAFLEAASVLYEDATVGLLLELAGIALEPVDPFWPALISERHTLQRVYNKNWDLFRDRERALHQSLATHEVLQLP